MVGDLGKSLWLKEIFGSVHGEKRPWCHIRLLKQNEKSTQYKVFLSQNKDLLWVKY